MKHLSEERLLDLAQKINQELPFTPEDRRDMMHIAACEECYQLLRFTMLVAEGADHIGESICLKEAAPAAESAVIRVVIVNMAAMLQQLQAETVQWSFSQSLAGAGLRSADGTGSKIEKLEDDETARTFVAVDPATGMLVIQLDAASVTGTPRAILEYADGTRREIPLEKKGSIYLGQVSDLGEGEYRIILEK